MNKMNATFKKMYFNELSRIKFLKSMKALYILIMIFILVIFISWAL
jgi:hypothetical protein